MAMFQISGKVHKQNIKLWEQKPYNSLEHESNTCPSSAWMSGEPTACGPIGHQFTSPSFHTILPIKRESDTDSNLEALSNRSTPYPD
jgi:hypothetical protein